MDISHTTEQALARYKAKQAERKSVSEPDTNEALWSYRKAAAVLHCFRPDVLKPLNSAFSEQKARIVLFDDITYAAGRVSEGLFTLKPAIRNETLRTFPSRRAMLQAIHVNPEHVETDLQKMWENYLTTGQVPDPQTLSYRQLTNLHQLISWVDGWDKNLPELTDILNLIREKSVLASFEHLVISNFTGRTKELAEIREHIGALPPATTVDAIRRQIIQWMSIPSVTVLVIHGSGGIGKSALVGRLLWEHTQSLAQIPFAYLAFDQPTLRIENPYTILVEMAAQLALQFPNDKLFFERFTDSVTEYHDRRRSLGSRGEVNYTREGRINTVQDLNQSLYNDFTELLTALGSRRTVDNMEYRPPILLVLDSFEEVQYRDRESLSGFWLMLNFLQNKFPALRIIICGRAAVVETGTTNVTQKQLKELAISDRVTLLNRLGVSGNQMAEAVAKQVGGNPLSLRLAANVITSNPSQANTSGIIDLATHKWLFFQIDEQLIQGQLYRRILDHIHNEKVRKLAHPGMILRRVTPDIILNVLAPNCQLDVKDIKEAKHLFEELKREHALVHVGESGALIYRHEIRQAMIKLLQQDKYHEVKELHRAAIDYYKGKEGLSERAEEIYHRLALGEDDSLDLDWRWIPGIEQSIAANQDDYPDQMKVWLASRMNLEVPRSVFANADIVDWERNITRKVQRALSQLQIEWALELLAERDERTEASPLFALEAKAHLLMNNLDEADNVLQKGVTRVSESTNRGRLAELFWLQAQVVLLRNEPDKADELLLHAEQVIEKATNPIPHLQILCHRLLLREEFPDIYPPATTVMLRSRLAEVCARVDKEVAYTEPFIIELALYGLADEFPATSERLREFVSGKTSISAALLTSENLRGLEEYREAWEENEISLESAV